MKVRMSRCHLPDIPPSEERFEAVREHFGRILPGSHRGHEMLRHAIVECRTGEIVDGRTCEHCGHFLNAVPSASGRGVFVRCVLFETDTVDALMIHADELTTITQAESAAIAAARMVDHAVGHLVVVEEDEAVGLVDARTVARGGRLSPRGLPVVPKTMSLGVAARLFREGELDAVGVVDGDELVGLLTRGDLRRAGVPI